jgi:hypothetical protein
MDNAQNYDSYIYELIRKEVFLPNDYKPCT